MIKAIAKSSGKEHTFEQVQWDNLPEKFKRNFKVITKAEPILEEKPTARDKRKPPVDPQPESPERPAVEENGDDMAPTEAGESKQQPKEAKRKGKTKQAEKPKQED